VTADRGDGRIVEFLALPGAFATVSLYVAQGLEHLGMSMGVWPGMFVTLLGYCLFFVVVVCALLSMLMTPLAVFFFIKTRARFRPRTIVLVLLSLGPLILELEFILSHPGQW